MEQERGKREAEETEFQSPSIPTLCANNCGFFGSSATNNLCSKCYRDSFLAKSKASLDSILCPPPPEPKKPVDDDQPGAEARDSSSAAEQASPAKKPGNRCSFCNTKVGLMGFKCRCGDTFCSAHRYSDKHGCEFDYKGAGQDAIAKANPVVKADKVEKI